MENLTETIRKNLYIVRDNIVKAALSSGRNPGNVKLVVVTKSFPVETVRCAAAAGADIFGENYPEESIAKIQTLSLEFPNLQWHMIGHCQSRKAKLVAEKFHYMHSLDSLDLAKKLNQRLADDGKLLPVLLEFNIGGEENKKGWKAADTASWKLFLPEIREISLLQHLEIRGLMTMPPFSLNPENSRYYFMQLVKLRDFLSYEFPKNQFLELSMGTSVDYPVAVQEGATFLRIGEAILGPRQNQ